MWIFIVIGIIGILGVIHCLFFNRELKILEEKLLGAALVIIGWVICWFAIGFPVSALSTGVAPGYGSGEQSGYVVNVACGGLIWKTYEIEMQVGQGEESSLSNPFKISSTDLQIINEVKKYLGEKVLVKIKYRQWLIMPYRLGETDKEIVSIKPL